jgi:hypothetical protein
LAGLPNRSIICHANEFTALRTLKKQAVLPGTQINEIYAFLPLSID